MARRGSSCLSEQPSKENARAVTYVIAEPCINVKDASCVAVCPVDCIYSTDQDAM
jgi:Fe-S-cluster-containing dehydrogenase component